MHQISRYVAMPHECISPAALQNYIRGESSGADITQIERHLENCSACQAEVERISELPDSTMRRVSEAIYSHATDVTGRAPDAEAAIGHRMPVSPMPSFPIPSSWGAGDASPQAAASGSRDGQVNTQVEQCTNEELAMEKIRDYRILDCIGQGGMGKVYRAWHSHLNKIVAVKLLKSEGLQSEEAKSRFAREMRLLAGLEHPQMVRALDAGEDQGVQYFAMEFVPGVDLGQLLQRLGPLPVPEVCTIGRLTADVLSFAHQNKVIHRDIKPSNLMLTPEGNVKLLDLGLAQIFDLPEQSALTKSGLAVGTLAYMAPELLAGGSTVSPRLDIYSLGVTICELLIGFRPFEAPGTLPMVQDIRALRPDVPAELNVLVQRMIALDPAQRPASMEEVQAELLKVVAQSDLTSLVAEYYRWTSRPSLRSLSITPPPVAVAADSPRMSTETVADSAKKGRLQTIHSQSGKTGRDWVLQHLGWFLGITCLFLMLYWIAADRWTLVNRQELSLVETPSDAMTELDHGPPANGPQSSLIPESDLLTNESSDEAQQSKRLEAEVTVTSVGEVSEQLLSEGRITITHVTSGEQQILRSGDQQLACGEYSMSFDCPMEIREQGQSKKVLANSPNRWNIQTTLKRRFQFPKIPEQAGAFASYYGSIWKEGWAKEESNTYELQIRTLGNNSFIVTPNDEPWLQVKVTHTGDPGGYFENAYLKIDMDRWEGDKQLRVLQGFVEYGGRDIRRYLRQHHADRTGISLVLPFDKDNDPVANLVGCDLPSTRLNVHDFLTLFFGADNFSAADVSIRKLRAQLAQPGSRHSWLDEIDNGTGPVPCFVASSRTREQALDQYGYSVWQRDEELFGFVQLEVKLPMLDATCMLRNASSGSLADLVNHFVQLEQARRMTMEPAELYTKESGVTAEPKPQTPFDLATLPVSPAWVVWRGEIERAGKTETIEVEALCQGRVKQDDRELCWLEFKVSSLLDGLEHTEWARLAIDVDKYEQTGAFQVEEGWIAFASRDNVFRMPDDGDLRKLADDRIQRQTSDAFNQVGVVDTLAMLFGAGLQPKSDFQRLRASIAGVLAGRQRNFVPDEKQLKIGRISGNVWKQPLLSPVIYEFFKSENMPFGFVSASLSVPKIVELGLEVQRYADDATRSILGNTASLVQASKQNRQYITGKAKPGWRVWTWKHSGTVYKTWAEFGGIINGGNNGKHIVLTLPSGISIRVIHSELKQQDREFAELGRYWEAWPGSGAKEKFVLVEDNSRTGKLVVGRREKVGNRVERTRPLDFSSLPTGDREWVIRRRSAIKDISWRVQEVVAAWEHPEVYRLPPAYQ